MPERRRPSSVSRCPVEAWYYLRRRQTAVTVRCTEKVGHAGPHHAIPLGGPLADLLWDRDREVEA
jgi:hypothetical protein